jgi:hypothetical protein
MGIFHLAAQPLKAIPAHLISRTEERVLESLLRSEAFLGIVFEESAEETVAFCAKRGVGRGNGGCGVRVEGAVVPLLQITSRLGMRGA